MVVLPPQLAIRSRIGLLIIHSFKSGWQQQGDIQNRQHSGPWGPGFIGLRSGNYGSHFSTKEVDIIWALWHGALFCLKYPSEGRYILVIKGGYSHQQYSGRQWHLNAVQLTLIGLKCANKISPKLLNHHTQSQLKDGLMFLHVMFRFKLNLSFKRLDKILSLLLSNFGNCVQTIFSVFCSYAAIAHLLQASTCCMFRPDALRGGLS